MENCLWKTCTLKSKTEGLHFNEKHFANLEDILNLEESVVVNCMSIGSRELFNDQEFIPARGQIIHFKHYQEEIDYMLFQMIPNSNYFFHIYPWSDCIILGGVYEFGDEEPAINPDVINKIIENANQCLSGNL